MDELTATKAMDRFASSDPPTLLSATGILLITLGVYVLVIVVLHILDKLGFFGEGY